MHNILIILFAILDCNVWSIEQIVSWSDELIGKLERPKTWLMDLSLSHSRDDALEVIREAMKDSGVQLPDDIGDLMVGLILLRFYKDNISEDTVKNNLADVVDAYGANCVDVEAVFNHKISDSIYSTSLENAENILKFLSNERLLEINRRLIEERE